RCPHCPCCPCRCPCLCVTLSLSLSLSGCDAVPVAVPGVTLSPLSLSLSVCDAVPVAVPAGVPAALPAAQAAHAAGGVRAGAERGRGAGVRPPPAQLCGYLCPRPPPPAPGLPPEPPPAPGLRFSPQDYEPTIFYPKRSPDPLHRDFTTQCEKMDIPFLSYLPTEVQLIDDAYNAVVDAVLGAEGTPGTEGTEPCAAILATLRHVRIPIVSLDVPSGWVAGALGGSGDISPDVLVSLAAPKEAARRFRGRRHFLAGRFVPEELRRKFGLSPPEYPGSDCVVAL
uniref:Uncharacterized protein n=1 Tax=Geospiza parvula TaxID=87175 RepID=A0A8C3QBX1_GEOPR